MAFIKRIPQTMLFCIGILFNITPIFGMEDNFNQHIVKHDDSLTFVHYKASQPKGIIIWIHGGPFQNPLKEGLKNREHFFLDLVQEGYTIVAPVIPLVDAGEGNKAYKNILNKITNWAHAEYLDQKIYVLSHSYGAHWTGQTLVDNDAPLRNLTHKLVLLSGTTHHAAGDLRRSMTDPEAFQKMNILEEGNHFWENNDLFTYTSQNNEKMALLAELSDWELLLGLQLNSRYKMNITGTFNPIMDKSLNDAIAIASHVDALPNIPQLVINPLRDMAVTVDTGAYYIQKLKGTGRTNVFFFVPEEAPHNWMINQERESKNTTYKQLFSKIISFLSDENTPEEWEGQTQTSLQKVTDHLRKFPKLNYVHCIEQFWANEPIEFICFDNSSLNILSDADIETSVTRQIRGRDKIWNDIHKLNQIIQVAFPPEFMTQEILSKATSAFDAAPDSQKEYFASILMEIQNKLEPNS